MQGSCREFGCGSNSRGCEGVANCNLCPSKKMSRTGRLGIVMFDMGASPFKNIGLVLQSDLLITWFEVT